MRDRRTLDLMHSDAYHDYSRSRPAREGGGNKAGRTPKPTRRHRSMNFEEYAAEGNNFINEVSWKIGCSRDEAAHITRAVLHSLRDRLPANDAVQFAQGLPLMIKGIYFDQYDISRTPVVVRTASEFLDMVYFKNRQHAVNDFPNEGSVVRAVQGVFRVLERRMDHGQVQQIKRMLNREIVEMIEGY